MSNEFEMQEVAQMMTKKN